MTDLETRLEALLGAAADSVTGPPLVAGWPRALHHRRRRNRRITTATVSLAAVALALGAANRLTGSPSALQAAGPGELDADGVPIDTGPELDWREVDPPPGDVATTVWTGREFVALAADGNVLASDDGETWRTVGDRLPAGFRPAGATLSGDRILAWGSVDDGSFLIDPAQVIVSEDDGRSWRSVGVLASEPAAGPEDPVALIHRVTSVAAAGDLVVVATSVEPVPDLTLIEDLGDPRPVDPFPVGLSYADTGRVTVRYCPVALGDDDACPQEAREVTVTSERVGDFLKEDDSRETIWVSSGDTPLEQVETEGDTHGWLVSTGDGFVGHFWADGPRLQSSTDGRAWTPMPLPGDTNSLYGHGRSLVAIGTDGNGNGNGNGAHLYRSADGGTTWDTIDYPLADAGLAVGPTGIIGLGAVSEEPPGLAVQFIDWLGSVTGANGEDEAPEPILGWSVDGRQWGWQSTEEAFGQRGWPTITLGADRAVARLDGAVDGDVERRGRHTRWFVADLAEG